MPGVRDKNEAWMENRVGGRVSYLAITAAAYLRAGGRDASDGDTFNHEGK